MDVTEPWEFTILRNIIKPVNQPSKGPIISLDVDRDLIETYSIEDLMEYSPFFEASINLDEILNISIPKYPQSQHTVPQSFSTPHTSTDKRIPSVDFDKRIISQPGSTRNASNVDDNRSKFPFFSFIEQSLAQEASNMQISKTGDNPEDLWDKWSWVRNSEQSQNPLNITMHQNDIYKTINENLYKEIDENKIFDVENQIYNINQTEEFDDFNNLQFSAISKAPVEPSPVVRSLHNSLLLNSLLSNKEKMFRPSQNM